MGAEMDRVEELLRRLDEEPPTPSVVDVHRAVVDGRRRSRVRAIVGTTVAGLAATLATAGTVAVVQAGAPQRSPFVVATDVHSVPSRPAAPKGPSACTVAVLPF